MRPAVFLDRDGVVNLAIVRDGRPHAPTSLAEFEILPGVDEGLCLLRTAGFEIVVVTNQPDVAKGILPREAVEAMHEHLRAELHIDTIMVCYHTDEDRCACRKPKPGMLLEAARRKSLDLQRSYMIGDRWRDIDAGRNAGCRTILLDQGYSEKKAVAPDWIVDSFSSACRVIANRDHYSESGDFETRVIVGAN